MKWMILMKIFKGASLGTTFLEPRGNKLPQMLSRPKNKVLTINTIQKHYYKMRTYDFVWKYFPRNLSE